ncbi:unnamed protein product [[Candida] boidinii]|uniref:Unnamed protein product n=1 Tax=Candida boidinii TaxID=5477 RepID=A0ACB5TM06_CANBO|nr:unnamed protein product [[Candida] boidinii]
MLSLNTDKDNLNLDSSTNEEELIWKVLVLDQRSTAIVSSVLRVNDLLGCGITIHSLITAKRAALPEVPVIYFLEPTPENIAKIITDLEKDQYGDFYINFTSSLGRALLEDFAKKVAMTGKSFKIKQVFDQYLDFIVTEVDLFSLDLPKLYSKFNNPSTPEDDITIAADKIANSLFATIMTMGSIPIIRCPRGGPAELIGQRLDQKLRDHVINTKYQSNSHSNGNNGVNGNTNIMDSGAGKNERSVLVLLDRNMDLASMFAHSWIYQCMVSDVFNLDRNTITIKSVDKEGKETISKYDIDPRDFFWASSSVLPFPDAVENVEKELEKYKQEAQELTNRTGISKLQDIDPNSSDTLHIQQAVKALPELTARKAIIDMHMKVLAALLTELETKSLDSFFEIEQDLNDVKVQKQFLELLKSSNNKGDNSIDKLRTYIMIYLQVDDLSSSFIQECEKILEELNLDLSSLKYIKNVKQFLKMSSFQPSTSNHSNSNKSSGVIGSNDEINSSALFNSLSSKLYGLTDGRISEGVGSLITGLRKLLPEKKQLPITNVIEAIMNPQEATQESINLTDDYLYFDPRMTRGSHSKPPRRQQFLEAVVFVVGGGNYLEYQNLQEWSNSTNSNGNNKLVVYGSTSIITANEFLEECKELGS